MADGHHIENRYIAISQQKIIRFRWFLYTTADFELDERHVRLFQMKKLHWTDSEFDRRYFLFIVFLVMFMTKQMRLDVSCGKILNSCKCSVDIFMPWPIFPSRTISPMSAIAACYYDATVLYCRIMSCVNWSLTVLTGSFFVTCLSGIDYRLSRIDHAHVTHVYYNSLTLTFTRPISMTQPVPV